MGRKQGWQSNRMGEYTVVRRYPGVGPAGRVYEAFHTRTGAPALLVSPYRTRAAWAPAAPWVLRASAAHTHLALELVQAPPAEHLPRVGVGLLALAEALARVDERGDAVEALTGTVAAQRRRRARWHVRPALWGALAGAALLALVLAPRTFRAAGTTRAATPVQLAEAARVPVATAVVPERWSAVGLEMPRQPFPGQRRPPCKRRGEVAINGGCWVKLAEVAPPCESDAYEYRNGCYWPSYNAPRQPTTEEP